MTKPKDLLNTSSVEVKPVQESGAQAQITAGQMLRAAREEQGIDLGLLASSLKVTVRQLELLEADQYGELPDTAFTRNFAISVARRLKVDVKQVAERLPKMENTPESNMVIKPSHDARGAVMKDEILPRRKRSGRWWLLLLGLVMVLIGLVFLLPQWGSGRSAEGSRAVDNVGGTSVPVQVSPLRMQSMPTIQSEVQREVVSPVTPSSQSVTPLSVNVPVTNASTVESEPATELMADTALVQNEAPSSEPVPAAETVQQNTPPAAAVVAAAVPTENQQLEIKSRSESWLRVTTASGKTLYQNVLKGGATYSLVLKPEDLPLSIRVGKANDAVVTVRGKAMNLSPYIVGDVADFKIK